MKQRFSRWYPKFPDKLLQNRHYVLYGTAMQLPALACALQRAVTERANIHFDYANILSKHVGANVYAMMSCNNCIPMCHEYLGKVTRRSFSPKPEVEWLARETSVQSCYLTATWNVSDIAWMWNMRVQYECEVYICIWNEAKVFDNLETYAPALCPWEALFLPT